jgi:hypothetical protein
VGPDGWTAPQFNDDGTGIEPYLPNIQNQLLRNMIWWFRNPGMNLADFILGVEDKNYTIWASDHPLQNSGRDCQPYVDGLRWAVLFPKPQWCTWYFLIGWLGLTLFVSPWFHDPLSPHLREVLRAGAVPVLLQAGLPGGLYRARVFFRCELNNAKESHDCKQAGKLMNVSERMIYMCRELVATGQEDLCQAVELRPKIDVKSR